MSANSDEQQRPAKRGDAAWKERVEGVAASNQRARKAGREEREAFDRKRAELRRADFRRRQARVAERRTP